MTKRLLLLLIAVLPTVLWAADGDKFNKDNIYYRVLSESAKTCQVYSYLANGYYDMVIPEQVNGYTVVAVRDSAFIKSRNLSSITFPKTIKRIGKYACYDTYYLHNVTIQGCDTICDYAFFDSHNLTTVNIEDGVKWIGDYAFMVYYYQWRPNDPYYSPSEYVLPNSVEHIGKCAFAHNKQLVNVVLPRQLSKISEYMFDDCPNLKRVEGIQWEGVDSVERNAFGSQYLESEINITNASYVGEYAFNGCGNATIRIGENLKEVGEYAFYCCYGLVSPLHITKDMKIGANSFTGCSNVESITVDDGLSDYYPTNGCNALLKRGYIIQSNNGIVLSLGCAKTIIPDGVGEIASYAFAYCKNLKSIAFPNNKLYIYDSAFQGCENLTEVKIPETVVRLSKNTFYGCDNLEKVEIFGSNDENYYHNIESPCFQNCPKLKTIMITGSSRYDSRDNCNAIIETEKNKLIEGCAGTVIPNSITEIGNEAFRDIDFFQSITVPEGVVRIGASAFSDCDSIKWAVLPSSLKAVGYAIFENCPQMTTLTLRSKTPPDIDYYYHCGLFGHNDYNHKQCLYIPKGSYYSYMDNADYSYYFDYLVTEDGGTGKLLADDTFMAKNVEGVDVLYSVIDPVAKTVRVGTNKGKRVEINNKKAIGEWDAMPEGFKYTLTLPAEVNGYRVTAISDKAFQGKAFLHEIIMPEGLDSIGVEAFQGCKNLGLPIFPSTLEKLGRRAFADCSGMSGIPIIPDKVKDIPDECFVNCVSMWSPSLPHTLERIGRRAFYNIMGGHMFFPASLKSMGEEAYFGYMDGFATIQYRSAAMEPVEIPENAISWMITPEQLQEFWMKDQAPGLYVPKGSIEAYKTTKGWSKFWPGIYEMDDLDKCTVTYMLNGTEYHKVQVDFGREYVPDQKDPEPPTGYVFSGWTWSTGEMGGKVVMQDLTINGSYLPGQGLQVVRTAQFVDEAEQVCGTIDVNYLLDVRDGHYTALVYKPRAELDPTVVMTEGITAFSNPTGQGGTLCLPESITDDMGYTYSVDSIGAVAFYGCDQLKGIRFPSTVKKIGAQAFQRSALEGIVRIPFTISHIGIQAFANTKKVQVAIFEHVRADYIWWEKGNKDDFAGPNGTQLDVCDGIVRECQQGLRQDNFAHWYEEVPGSVAHIYKQWSPDLLMLNGIIVTASNSDDILGDGTATYNRSSHTLTLNGCNSGILRTTVVGGLTISLKGKNRLESLVAINSDVTISSDSESKGRLVIAAGIRLNRSDMTISNCRRVEIPDLMSQYGLWATYYEKCKNVLTVDHSELMVENMRGFTDLNLQGVSLPYNTFFTAAWGDDDQGRPMTNIFEQIGTSVKEKQSVVITVYDEDGPIQLLPLAQEGEDVEVDFASTFSQEGATPYGWVGNNVYYHLRETANDVLEGSTFYLATAMTDEQMDEIAAAGDLNSEAFQQFSGFVMKVNAGSGYILVGFATNDNESLTIKVGTQKPAKFKAYSRITYQIPYSTPEPCYIYVYLTNEDGRQSAAARRAEVYVEEYFYGSSVAKIFRLGVSMDEASGVHSVTNDAADKGSRWYDLQGRRVSLPKQKGLYIRNRRKVLVK